MAVLSAQLAMSLAVLAFAAVALRVAGALPGHARGFAYAWAFIGWAYLIEGANSLFHDLFAITGFLGGPESRAWAAVLRWHPVLNHSRTFLLTSFCAVLAFVLYRAAARGTEPSGLRRPLAVVIGFMFLGGLVGWLEPVFTPLRHYSAVATLDILAMAAIMALLVVGMNTGRMDRALWFAIGINGFVVAISVLLFAAVSRVDILGEWWPRPLYIQIAKAGLHTLMVVVGLVHLRRIRQGRPVRGLLEAPARPAGIAPQHL